MSAPASAHEGPFPEMMRLAVMDQVEPFMKRLDPEGFFRQEDPRSNCLNDGQFIYPLAYVYRVRFAGNRYCREPGILDAVRRIGDFIAARTLPSGEILAGAFGYTWKAVDQRLLTCWMDAHVLIRTELSAGRRKRWESAMRHSLANVAARVKGYLDQERFSSLSFDTSPNHACLYGSTLLLGATLFQQKEWRSLALAFMDRFVRFQTPEGYWPEGGGPVGIYNMVTLAGVARAEALCPRPAYRRALARALAYSDTVLYPDGTFVTLIDKRQHYYPRPFIWGMFGLTHWPRGRALLRQSCRARLRIQEPFTGDDAARWLENYVHYRPGPLPRYAPWKGTRFLGNYAALFRQKGWQWNFSVHASVVNPRSPFQLDQQNFFSLRHDAAGLIVADSQDKSRPKHYTFLLNGPDDLGVFGGGRIGALARPPYVEAVYSNGLTGRVSVNAITPQRMIVRAVERTPTISSHGYQIGKYIPAAGLCFNLPLYVHQGATLRVGRRKFVLARKKLAIPVPAGGRVTLFGGKVLLKPRTPAILHYPCEPFNPYARDNKSKPDTWFLRMELPMKGKPRSAEIEIEVRA